jgi:hypothetical protein
MEVPSAGSTTISFEVRAQGQDGVNEVVDVSSGTTRTSPRFCIGSTGALPGRGIGEERFLSRRVKTNYNKTTLRSSTTGRFISSKKLEGKPSGTTVRSLATGRLFYGGSADINY